MKFKYGDKVEFKDEFYGTGAAKVVWYNDDKERTEYFINVTSGIATGEEFWISEIKLTLRV
jgi:hypothetical protein